MVGPSKPAPFDLDETGPGGQFKVLAPITFFDVVGPLAVYYGARSVDSRRFSPLF